MSHVVSIDPGEHVGVAMWLDDGTFLWKSVMSLDEFIAWTDANTSPISVVVYEDYTLRRNKATQQTGSKMQAAQAIGVAKSFAKRARAKIVRQQSDILRIAGMHAAVKLPQGHIPDDVSAYLHGFYYFEKIGVLKPVLQR